MTGEGICPDSEKGKPNYTWLYSKVFLTKLFGAKIKPGAELAFRRGLLFGIFLTHSPGAAIATPPRPREGIPDGKERIAITKQALCVLRRLKEAHGELILHQSGGCCDGSSPMVLRKDEFYLDESDVLLGELDGVGYYMNREQFEYWKHTHLTVDVTAGRGASFSLEIPLGVRFIIRSDIY